MSDCKYPKCKYSENTGKCIKPNGYIELMAWCKRNNVPNFKELWQKNKQYYREKACKYFEERKHYVQPPKPLKECLPGKVRNPRTGRCIKIKIKKECLPGKVRNPRTGRCIKIRKKSNSIKETSPKNTIIKQSPKSINSYYDFSSLNAEMGSSRKSTISFKQESYNYDKIFKRQYIEKRRANYIRKRENGKDVKDADVIKDVLKKSNTKIKLNIKKPKYLKKHPFIKDFFDKEVKEVFEKQEKQSLKEILSPSKSYKSSTDKAVIEFLKKIKAKKIQKYLKQNLLKKYFTLEKRLQYFKYVRSFVRGIDKNSCIKAKEFKDKQNKVVKGYTIDNIIDLEKKIGTESSYGVIYRTSIKNMLGRSPIASKLMNISKDNYKEIQINTNITNNILRNSLSRHFLLTYKAFECNKPGLHLPNIIANASKYYICLNELAHGDLANLCENMDFMSNNELIVNIATQCILSIATFHRLGYTHNDCHWGNFLYHITEDVTGYYHYKVYGKDLYLKNCGYTMMIYDFGYAEKSKYSMIETCNDYMRPMHAFINKNSNGWGPFPKLPDDIVSNQMKNFIKQVSRGMYTYDNEKSLLMNIIIPSLINMPYKVLFTQLPQGQSVINSTPYVIDDTLLNII